jgi:protein tyrosine phosphatase (PTP) superfamily phosphohydrolase (DUF442 family)
MMSMRALQRRRVVVLAAVVAVAAVVASGAYWRATYLPKRFAVVEPGRLYRSGEVSARQLAHVQRDFGVQRVVCLLDANAPVTHAERETATRLGLEWQNVSLTGDGASLPADRVRLLALLADPNAPPTLVHCAAGTNRTGLAVGLYRLHQQHWTLEQVMAEMGAFDFENLPKHENLRQALASEAAIAAGHRATTQAGQAGVAP